MSIILHRFKHTGIKVRSIRFLVLQILCGAAALLLGFPTSCFSQNETLTRPIVIAHRGASAYLPEHTLEAKALAYAMGADFLEQDLVLTKDGIPVVLHDIQIDTVTDVADRFPDRKRKDGRFYAIDFTLAELRQLKVTERFNPKTKRAVFEKRFPLWQSTFHIHTFEEEIQFIQGLNHSTGRQVGIYPEIKSPAWHRKQGQDISKITLEILNRYGYRTKQDPFYVQCFEFDEVKRLRNELGFQGRLIQLLGEKPASLLTPDGLREIAKVADGIGPSIQLIVTSATNGGCRITDLVTNAHLVHLKVHPYTLRADELPSFVSSLEELEQILFLKAGIDGVFSDFPDRTVNYLTEHFSHSVNTGNPK